MLSPILFIVYMDELIVTLSKSHLGCHMGPFYAGALGYTLMMYNVTFNSKKTMSITFGSPVTGDDKVYFDGVLIKWYEG